MGPLAGKKIIEIKGLGPGPYAGMLLADLGAEVIVVERSSQPNPAGLPSSFDIASRGKKSIALNLKSPEGVEALLCLVESADAIFEAFRPGVAEKLGIGPEPCLARNPKIVYGRLTGWGQSGPLAKSAGHDLNYIALTGVAAAIGTQDQPVPPLNLVGDYAAGSLFMVVGILSALIEVATSGKGQVIDAAITDGSAHLMSLFYSLNKLGAWQPARQANLLDGGCPFYQNYKTADDKYICVAAIEPPFFAEMISLAQLPDKYCAVQNDQSCWPEMQQEFAECFRQKTRDEWAAIFEGTDACVMGVLDYQEAQSHRHNVARKTYIDVDGERQPAPAPRFSRTVSQVEHAGRAEGQDTESTLLAWGISAEKIKTLKEKGAID